MPLSFAVSPYEEMVAYETLWAAQNSSFKSISELFSKCNALPSEVLRKQSDMFLDDVKNEVEDYLSKRKGFSVCLHGDFQYPQKLRAAEYPVELFYYKGDLNLAETRCISVVGSRKCSHEGVKRTNKLVKRLVEKGFTIVSGLAIGIDTAAHTTAISNKGRTIGVIGTPIDKYYPPENIELQNQIAKDFLLISQVPFYRYEVETFNNNRFYFPQRNITMAALSEATIIVEASDTSGTLTQARACLQQGKKLFILNSCFENDKITWPENYEKKGAIRVNDFDDIFSNLE